MWISIKAMTRNHKAIGIAIAIGVFAVLPLAQRYMLPTMYYVRQKSRQNAEMMRTAEKLVRINVTPAFNYSFDLMRTGVIQHLDREYTYDTVPTELLDGFLFQGIHRPPKGTSIEFELLTTAKVYFFFHPQVDGGYSEIFSRLKDWKRSAEFPQYDIYNGDHGLKMVMFQMEATAGTYFIPPTSEDRACFNIVFKAIGSDHK